MARLSKIQKFYIEGNLDESSKKVAKDLGLEQSTVDNYINKISKKMKDVSEPVKEVQPEPEQDENAPVNISPAHGFDKLDLFARKKEYGVVAMTAAGSSAGDDSRKRVPTKPPVKDGVYKMRPDKD